MSRNVISSVFLLTLLVVAGIFWYYPKEVVGKGGHGVSERDVEWLALNIYYHRGETNTDSGRKAITAVVFNRLDDREHYWGPKSIEGIITFRYKKGRKDCDFSWYCNGLEDTPDDAIRYAHDRALAKRWLTEYRSGRFKDPTGGATWFIYRNDPLPLSWKRYNLKRAGTYGEYRFYKF